MDEMGNEDERFTQALRELSGVVPPDRDLSEPFVALFPVTGTAISTLGDLLGSETVSASDAQAAPPGGLAVRPRHRPVLGCAQPGPPRPRTRSSRETERELARLHRGGGRRRCGSAI